METLGIHIEYLLQRHECVILPGIGAFIVSNDAARIDMATGEIIPPTRSICFNSAVCNDDGLLVNSMARRERISFAKARQDMQRQIENMRRVLESDAEVTIGKVGILRLDNEGNISFMPRLDARAMSARMGMPALDLSFLHPESKRDEMPATPAAAAPAPEDRKERLGDRYYIISKRKVRKLLRTTSYAAAVAIIAIAGAVAAISGRGVERNVAAPSEASVVPETVTRVIIPKKVEAPESPAASEAEAAKGGSYSLVVGSFRSETEADEYIAQHHDSDYGLQKERSTRHIFVTAANSADKDALVSLSGDSEFAKEYPQSWVRKRN